ncbi:MAG: SGNH/GDSL hydrolase family protein [Myxococcales bacterium]
MIAKASAGRRSAAALAAILCGCGGVRATPSPAPSPAPPPAPPTIPTAVPPAAPELRLEGRFDTADPAGPRFAWPGSAIWLRFTGTSAKVRLFERSLETDGYGRTAHSWYDVSVDGTPLAPFEAAEGSGWYPLVAGLAGGDHLLVLRKRTEAYVADSQLLGFELDAGARALPVSAPARRIEFIGDSITAGFGVDGPDAFCSFSSRTENYAHTYAALAAQALGADQVALAATGLGVYRNWGGSTDETIGARYGRTLPTDRASSWDFERWKPDAVVIDLGTNDFGMGDPGSAAFVGAYRALLAQVRRHAPSALIVVALGPMLSDLFPVGAHALTRARADLASLVASLKAAGDARVELIEFPNQDGAASFGCRTHPSAATQQRMADQLVPLLRARLSW